jgi:REP element-mobilizing transposase RayT
MTYIRLIKVSAEATIETLVDDRTAAKLRLHDPPFDWGRGGRRPGAGRKRKSPRASVVHRTRPTHALRYPSHVTIPFLKVVGNLRTQLLFNALRAIFRKRKRGAPERSFQVVHFSVQKDHVHLLVEAVDREAFSLGMRSLTIRTALRLNQLLRRKKGKVIRDRYHRRDLFDAPAVRTALRYVLLNGAKHGCVGPTQLDPFSSAITFDGWSTVVAEDWHAQARGDPDARRVTPWSRLLNDWRDLLSSFEAARWHTEL